MNLYDLLVLFPHHYPIQLKIGDSFEYEGDVCDIPSKYVLPTNSYVVDKVVATIYAQEKDKA